jgi:hypothetical protein
LCMVGETPGSAGERVPIGIHIDAWARLGVHGDIFAVSSASLDSCIPMLDNRYLLDLLDVQPSDPKVALVDIRGEEIVLK